ncbi:hypothetical protein [Emticicia sp. C21]|uniref:hypothetical protein n=1 Tax=Emticicia sp. C21 TaxID=2302915 RepID=UPI001E531E32|nr:hypothetical protein [Emticicia sp. C21]
MVTSNKVLFHQEVTNDKTGIDSFIKALKKQTDCNFKNCLFCMGFTGIYNNILLNYLTAHKASIWTVGRCRRECPSDKR